MIQGHTTCSLYPMSREGRRGAAGTGGSAAGEAVPALHRAWVQPWPAIRWLHDHGQPLDPSGDALASSAKRDLLCTPLVQVLGFTTHSPRHLPGGGCAYPHPAEEETSELSKAPSTVDFPVVQWLKLHAPNAGGPGSIPGQGTRSHMLQPRVHMPQLNILHAATKDPGCCN